MAVAWLFAVAAAATSTIPTTVIDVSASVEDCALDDEVRAALESAALGGGAGRKGWPKRIEIVVLAGDGPGSYDVLTASEDDSVVLKRRLHLRPHDCAALAYSIALLLDLYVSDLALPGDLAPFAAREPPVPQSVGGASSRNLALRASLGGSLLPRRSALAEVGIAMSRQHFELGGAVTGEAAAPIAVRRLGAKAGEVSTLSVSASVTGSLCTAFEGRVCAMSGLGAELLYGTSSGAGLAGTTSGFIGQPLLSFGITYDIPMQSRLLPYLAMVAVTRPARAGFAVAGADSDIRTALVSLHVTLGLRITLEGDEGDAQ